MVTSSVVDFEAQIRRHGAKVAAAISVVWITVGIVGTLWLNALGSSLMGIPALMLAGGIAALPVSTWLGWRLAPRAVRSGKAFRRMTLWTVVLTDAEIAIGVTLGILLTSLRFEALLFLPLGFVIGLVIYGLPGLAMAIPSAWVWERAVRNTFPEATQDDRRT